MLYFANPVFCWRLLRVPGIPVVYAVMAALRRRRIKAFGDRELVEALNELQLLTPRTLQLTHASGESFVLRDFQAVDEARFAELTDEQVLSLHKKGFLGWVYAHLMSLGNANQLFERFLERKPEVDDVSETKH